MSYDDIDTSPKPITSIIFSPHDFKMQLSTLLVSALVAIVSAAPTYPEVKAKDARSAIDSLGSLSDYFNSLAYKVKAAKVSGEVPVCDLSQARMPLSMSNFQPCSRKSKY